MAVTIHHHLSASSIPNTSLSTLNDLHQSSSHAKSHCRTVASKQNTPKVHGTFAQQCENGCGTASATTDRSAADNADAPLHAERIRAAFPRDGVLLGEGLRAILGVAVGDRVSIINAQHGIRFEQAIAGFVDEPTSPVVYISAGQLSALASSGVMLKLAPGVEQDAKRQAVMLLPGVTSYLTKDSVFATVRKSFRLYNVLVALTLLSAGVMAAALLYNALSANVSERTGELSTLQAAGMGAGMLGRLVTAENMMLAVIALPGGLIAGTLLAEWFLSTYVTQGYRWHLEMQTTTALMVAVGILLAALLAQAPAFRAIARMDVAKVVHERSL